MANEQHLKILRQGVEIWNEWRHEHPGITPSLDAADLSGADLSGVDLSSADLSGASLAGAKLTGAKLSYAITRDANLAGVNLVRADIRRADFNRVKLKGADLSGAKLSGVKLNSADLSFADLSSADLRNAQLNRARLGGAYFISSVLRDADFDQAAIGATVFANIDLRDVKGLEGVRHYKLSEISVSTIYLSEGQIPEVFLRGCGMPQEFIVQIPALVAARQPIQFYSCFISYSSKDEEFARHLHERMRAAGLRVWFAPEDIKGGQRLHEQIERAIQIHDRLLLVLSKESMKSEWVMTEIRRARRVEIKEGRRKLFPIRLVDYDALKGWECFDADEGKNLAREVREYFIPDFSNWKSHDDFEAAFQRLLADLKAST